MLLSHKVFIIAALNRLVLGSLGLILTVRALGGGSKSGRILCRLLDLATVANWHFGYDHARSIRLASSTATISLAISSGLLPFLLMS